MRKQVILLVTAFVFTLTLCGTVTAVDNSGSDPGDTVNSTDKPNSSSKVNSLKEITITGNVRDCVNDKPLKA